MTTHDGALLARWIESRDAEAFRALVASHSGMVYGVALRILRREATAEETAQECFFALARVGTIPAGGRIGAWLHGVATNQARQRLRSESRRRLREERYAARQPSSANPAWNDVEDQVDAALHDLPEDLREVIVRRFLEGESQTAIARALGVSRQTVGHRIKLGVTAVRDSLRERGVLVGVTALWSMLTAHAATAAPQSLTRRLGAVALAGPTHLALPVQRVTALRWLTAALCVLGLAFVMMQWWSASRKAPPGPEPLANPIAEESTPATANRSPSVTRATKGGKAWVSP